MDAQNIKHFRILYNQLDELLSKKTGIFIRVSFIEKLNKFVRQYPSFGWLKNDIRLIHDFRNIVVHDEKEHAEIAIPTNEYLDKVKHIIRTINHPQTALEIASQDIYGCTREDRVIDVVCVMAERNYTHIPVFLNKDNMTGFLGVFSESSLVNVLGKQKNSHGGEFLFKTSLKIANILPLIKKPINDAWDFVSKDTDIYKIKEMFLTKTFKNAELINSRLGVLFITEHGDPNEKMLGIITAWDLSKIEGDARSV